jgi:hypothetical protein
MRRRIVVTVMSLLAASALVVGGSVSVAGAAAAKAPVCAGKTKKKAIKDIEKAYQYFLDAETAGTAAEKEPFIEFMSGKQVSPAFQAQFRASSEANAAAAATTSVKVQKVKCTGKKSADVEFDLVLNGEVTPDLAPPGDAVISDGGWKVSGVTLCNTQALGSPDVLEAGPCSEILLDGEPSDLTAGT